MVESEAARASLLRNIRGDMDQQAFLFVRGQLHRHTSQSSLPPTAGRGPEFEPGGEHPGATPRALGAAWTLPGIRTAVTRAFGLTPGELRGYCATFSNTLTEPLPRPRGSRSHSQE
ncbi:hypothetical protein GCM10012280_14440 [Wenjunlia tyrosinilytica]|uniref:Uncharacterized protein n=1 Tax=Wenjunlia tyrosinilytica TaxID=1544741 RepID=A0A917ZKT5_9ACTN|nr:hypothetical protein GCM10012280_14440 [Wenjunlia tyrosinilytica]